MAEPVPDDVIAEALNPVTRSMVKFRPPFKVPSPAARREFEFRFAAYCSAAWAFARADPDEVRLLEGAQFEIDRDTPTDLWPVSLPEPKGASDG